MRKLNLLAQKFAEQLFEAFPEWRAFVEDPPQADANWLLVRVPSPLCGQSLEDRDLVIETRDNRVVLAFGPYPTTQFRPRYPDSPDAPLRWEPDCAPAMGVLPLILSEERCIAIALSKGEYAFSTLITPGSMPNFRSLADDIDRIIVRSWRGSFDVEYLVSDDGCAVQIL